MHKEKRPALFALFLFATAWFLPVEADGARITDGILPGYQALLVALGPVTLHKFSELDLITVRELLTAVSAFSNLVMLYALAVVLAWPKIHFPAPARLSTALLVAFIINAQWIWPRGGEFLELRIGYWLWCASFGLVAIAVRRLERRQRASGETPERDRRVTAVVAVLLAMISGSAGAQSLTPEDRSALATGGRVVRSDDVAGSAWPRITVIQFIASTPEESAAVFMDYARHALFLPNVLVSRVSRVVDAATQEVDYVLSVPVAPDEAYTVRNRVSGPNPARAEDAQVYRVKWTLVRASSTRSADGEAKFEPYSGGTLFTYRNLVVPGGRIAGLGIIRRKAQRDVEATAQAIAAKVSEERAGDRALLVRQLRALRAAVSP